MQKINSKEACAMAVNLIETQLAALPLTFALLSSLSAPGSTAADGLPDTLQFHRKPRSHSSGSAAVIAAADAGLETDPSLTFDIPAAQQALRDSPARAMHDQRILVSNALLAVGMFLKEHRIAATRTPEVQFLGHVCEAIIHNDRFHLKAGYLPGASFDGLIIDSSLDGARLFGDNEAEGFMAFGDAVALLQRLAQYLHGAQEFVSGGDAG